MPGEPQLWRMVLDELAHSGGTLGLAAALREETIPIYGVRLSFTGAAPHRFRVEPGGGEPPVRRDADVTVVDLPPLELHAMLIGECD